VIRDIRTVAWKELKEIAWLGGSLRGGRLSLIVLLFMFGVFLPYQSGREWVESPTTLFYWAWLPLMLVGGVVADSFAGERERHTLETLLASRLPDRAILLGKVIAAVGYGWSLVMVMLGLGLVTVNVAAGNGQPLLYSWQIGIGSPLMAALGAGLAAGAGVLVSLRAATVRQAAQTLNVAILLLIFVPIFGMQTLPGPWKVALLRWFTEAGSTGVAVAAGAVLFALDVALVLVAMARFRRVRLILD
jgi:ABC-2 type transport system permease protein